MKTIFIFIFFYIFFISGCSSKSSPEFSDNAFGYIEKFKLSKLSGDDALSRIYKSKASESIKKGSNIYLLEELELTDMAMDTALLKARDQKGFQDLDKVEHHNDLASYKKLITAEKLTLDDIDALPDVYRDFARDISENMLDSAFTKVDQIKNNISKLIALGVLVHYGYTNKKIYKKIIDISKAQGYKAVTLQAYMALELLYIKNNDVKEAKIIREKLIIIR